MRKREQRSEKMERHRRPQAQPQERCTALGEKELRIIERRQRLTAELAAVEAAKEAEEEAAEERLRNLIRRCRPCHSPTKSPEPRGPRMPDIYRARPERRRSFRVQNAMPDLHYPEYPSDLYQHRRPSRPYMHAEMNFHPGILPQREHFMREACPDPPRRHGRRRSSIHRSPRHQHHDVPPLIFEQVVERGGRRRSGSFCRQRSRHYLSEEDYDCEVRSPRDYWFEGYWV